MRLEMFCHGALCMAVSGKCYLSLHELNSSANRGACTQICRRSYTVTDRETRGRYPVLLPPKDLKTIHFLNKMIDAGVTVFKIEGRARGPEYVATAVGCYSEAIQAIVDGTYSEERIAGWDERLRKIFNRGFWNGYYLGQRLGEWSSKYGSSATRVKRYAAKGVRYFSNIGVAEFLVENGTVKVGDEVVITGPTTGALILTVDELGVDTSRSTAGNPPASDLILSSRYGTYPLSQVNIACHPKPSFSKRKEGFNLSLGTSIFSERVCKSQL